jgi:hypothetical protein
MSNVHTLETKSPDQLSTIEVLEELLADAKSGRIRSVAAAYITTNNGANTVWSNSTVGHALAGTVAILQRRILIEIDG